MQDACWARDVVTKQKLLPKRLHRVSDYKLAEGSLSPFSTKRCSQQRLVADSLTGNTVPTCRQDVPVMTHTQGGTEVSGTGTGRLLPGTAELTQGQPRSPHPRQKGNADIHAGTFPSRFSELSLWG